MMTDKNDSNKQQPWDRITAIIAAFTALTSVIVAVIGLYFTVQNNNEQLGLTRQHNRLSVMPIINIRSEFRSTHNKMGLAIENEGLGPARMKKIVFGVGDQWFYELGTRGTVRVLRELEIPSGMISLGGFGTTGRSILKSGEDKWIYSALHSAENSAERKRLLKKIRSNLNIAICYCSLYGECQGYVRRKPYPPSDLFQCE